MSLDHGRISAYDQESNDPFADVVRNFLHEQGHFRGDQDLRPATHPANSARSGSSGHEVNTMKISDEHKTADRRFVELVAESDDPPRDYFRHGHRLTAMRHILDFLNRAVRDPSTVHTLSFGPAPPREAGYWAPSSVLVAA